MNNQKDGLEPANEIIKSLLGKTGICTKCGEHTLLVDSCCGAGVWIEGAVELPKGNEYD